jgi:hypothetical protein
MKGISFLVGVAVFLGFSVNAQDDECTRYKAIAGNAYQIKNYEKVTMAYNKAQLECKTLDMKFYNPYIYSVKMAMRNAPDDAAKLAYLDTLINVYETAQATHGMQKQWQSYLGYSYLTRANDGDLERADTAYSIGIHHDGPKANEGMLQQYYANIYNLMVKSEDEAVVSSYKKRLITEFFQLSEYVNKGEMKPEIMDFLSIYLDKAVTDCDAVLPSIREFMTELPNDVETKKLTVSNFMSLLEKKDCTTSPEYAMLVDTIIAIDPSVGAVLAKAKLLLAQNKTSEAVGVFKEALEMTSDPDQVSDIEYEIASAYFRTRNYKSAHNAGLAVSGKNSSKGYEVAAKAVNAMMNDCGASTFDRKANNYYAVELAQKSGNSALVNAYKNQCPTSSDAFNEGLEAGDEVTLECWGRIFKIEFY